MTSPHSSIRSTKISSRVRLILSPEFFSPCVGIALPFMFVLCSHQSSRGHVHSSLELHGNDPKALRNSAWWPHKVRRAFSQRGLQTLDLFGRRAHESRIRPVARNVG